LPAGLETIVDGQLVAARAHYEIARLLRAGVA
jgi:hypothetical protein